MDPIERAGTGEPASSQVNDDLTPIEPAKTGTPAQQAQTVTPAENGDFLKSPQSDPGLEAQRLRLLEQEQKMIANNTRKTQDAAENHRRESEALTAERQQIAAQMQQQTMAQQAAAEAKNTESAGMASRFSPELQTAMAQSPDLRELVGHFDSQSSAQLDSLREENKGLAEQLQKVQGTAQTIQQQQIVAQMKPQIAAVQEKYGQNLTPDILQAATKRSLETGLDVETALFSISPQTVQDHMQAVANVAAENNLKKRFGDNLGGLAGIDDEFTGVAPNETYQPGESFEESFRRVNGANAHRQALQEGFEVGGD